MISILEYPKDAVKILVPPFMNALFIMPPFIEHSRAFYLTADKIEETFLSAFSALGVETASSSSSSRSDS